MGNLASEKQIRGTPGKAFTAKASELCVSGREMSTLNRPQCTLTVLIEECAILDMFEALELI
jgi:hypothetical protein